MKKGTLVLIRHGESRLNKLNVFTGWIDVALSELGIKEAQDVATHCQHYNYDAAFTSHLERAHETLLIILSKQEKIGVFQHESHPKYDVGDHAPQSFHKKVLPIYSSRALNERYYGDLQGLNKNMAAKKYGKEKVFEWRRGFKARPPKGESLKDVYQRVIPYFEERILPYLKDGKSILVAGHGNTLRAVIKFIEEIDDKKIALVDLPFGHPIVYEFSKSKFVRTGGQFNLARPLR